MDRREKEALDAWITREQPFIDDNPDQQTLDEALEQPLITDSGITIDDAINMHLVDCAQCRDATERRLPVKLGQKSGHCEVYWQMQLNRADYEGKINNIVAHTEHGDEAQIRGKLQ